MAAPSKGQYFQLCSQEDGKAQSSQIPTFLNQECVVPINKGFCQKQPNFLPMHCHAIWNTITALYLLNFVSLYQLRETRYYSSVSSAGNVTVFKSNLPAINSRVSSIFTTVIRLNLDVFKKITKTDIYSRLHRLSVIKKIFFLCHPARLGKKSNVFELDV